MAAPADQDYYALLRVGRAASSGEIRRAYRQLALRHHPDLAGAETTATFQLIVEAYQVLSDPEERAAYDARLRQRQREDGSPRGGEDPLQSFVRRRRRAGVAPGTIMIARLSGTLDELVARSAARVCPDGVIELHLTRAEGERGGTAAFDATLSVGCPTCYGLAEAGRLWCRRCEFAGTVQDTVTVCVPIPPFVRDATTFLVESDPLGVAPPLRVRVRVI